METSARPELFEDDFESPAPTTNRLGNDFGASKADESAEKSSGSRFECCSFGCVCLNLFSITLFVFFMLFVNAHMYADSLRWFFFFLINAAIPALFVIHYNCFCSCSLVNVIHLLSAIAAIWSIVDIVIALLDHSIFEITCALMGLFSPLYHSLMAKRCIKKDAVEDTSEKDAVEDTSEKDAVEDTSEKDAVEDTSGKDAVEDTSEKEIKGELV